MLGVLCFLGVALCSHVSSFAPYGATKETPGAHVRQWFDVHERSELPLARIESPGTGPRTCASGSMCTSEASCHGRELRAQALGRELTAEALRSQYVAIHRNICYPKSAWDTMRESAKKRYKVGCLRSLQGEQLASCSLAAGPSQEVWTSCLHSPLWGAL